MIEKHDICKTVQKNLHTHIYIYMVQACNPPLPPPRWWWFLGLGVLSPWNPTIMQGISASPPPLWGGLGAVCMYLRRLVGIGMYVCVYVCNVMLCYVMLCNVCIYASPPPLWGGLGVLCMYLRRLVGRHVSMCVCIYVCMYVCLYVCLSVCMYASPPPLWGGLGVVCLYLRRLVGRHVSMCVCMYVCLSVCLYVCMSVRTYVCMYVGGYHWGAGGVAGRRPGPYIHTLELCWTFGMAMERNIPTWAVVIHQICEQSETL